MRSNAHHHAALVATLALAVAACAGAGEQFKPLDVGDPAPAYAVRTLGGDSARVGTDAQPLTLVHVWATWCLPCEAEFPELEALHREFAPRGLRILAVSIDQGGDADVRAFVQSHGASFTIGRDPAGSVKQTFQTVGVPQSFLVGRDGRLLWKTVGAIPAGAADARAAIARALQ